MYQANNYGYNPYNRYVPQQPMQNMQSSAENSAQLFNAVQRCSTLLGRPVESIEMAKLTEYQLDGSTSYFPLADSSAIVTKQLQTDGTTKTIVYKPVDEKPVDKPSYVTIDDLNKEINKIDLSDIDDLKEEVREIKKSLKELKKKGD